MSLRETPGTLSERCDHAGNDVPVEELGSARLFDLMDSQERAFVAIMAGLCSPGCVGSIREDCDCRCVGKYHGAVWILDLLEVLYSDAEPKWRVSWSSPEQIARDSTWGVAQNCDTGRSFDVLDDAKRFAKQLAAELGVGALIVAFSLDA